MVVSPYLNPAKNLRIKDFTSIVPRPTPEEIERFPLEAETLLRTISTQQDSLLGSGEFNLDWVKGRHFLLAGATGPGLGGAIEGAVRRLTAQGGSVTVIARDISRSVGYEMGKHMKEMAEQAGFENRYHWINDGLNTMGLAFEKIVAALKATGAREIIYINTVAAAMSGLLPGYPPIYLKDVDEEGLFQWRFIPLSDQAIQTTRYVMGELAVTFPRALEKAGFHVSATCYIDWRGSLDVMSRDPHSPTYGRQGAYSTSLYLPKDYLHKDTVRAFGTGQIVLDCFLPIMRTRALPFIPGGTTMSYIYDRLMEIEGIRRREVPELALGVLDRIGRALSGQPFNPFPRLDDYEYPLDNWFLEIAQRLNNDESSEFHWKKWVKTG
jgi:hypothetical protein